MEIRKILIAPDKFKGSLSSLEVCRAVQKGIRKISSSIEVESMPVADGGEGTLKCLVSAVGGKVYTARVTGPLGNSVTARYGVLKNGTGVVEISEACGLALVPESKRNPLKTTTYGVGELISKLLDRKCKNIVIGIGGTSTNDGGFGMAEALGFRFLDKHRKKLRRGGEALLQLEYIDSTGADPRLKEVEVIACCDVLNPLTGKSGASIAFSRQKGANMHRARMLEDAMIRYAKQVRKYRHVDILKVLGSGSGGGIGGGARAFLGARLVSGAEYILQFLDYEKKLEGIDLVITGEGKMDGQSALGKAPFIVAKKASEKNIPVILIAGAIGEKEEEAYKSGVTAMECIADKPMSLEESISQASELLAKATARILRVFIGSQI
ncbi:MAG: glycerate kinase [Leptospiraceae bacterium]|nr:glycerate kinase [Leptospiraceae bacterium]